MTKNTCLSKNRKIVCIIPARGGSVGIPEKNLCRVGDKTLVARSIGHALDSKYIGWVFVSSDSDKILFHAVDHGAYSARRPPQMAMDWSRIEDAVNHVLDQYQEDFFDAVVMLQPTSPFRDRGDIDNAIELFFQSNADCVFSACRTHQFAWVRRKSGDQYERLIYPQYLRPRREDVRPIYHENGSIYVTKPRSYYRYNDRMWGRCIPYVQPYALGFEIDEPEDLDWAQYLWGAKK